ncbi:MAG: nascent polypeptide-associated complex protein [Thermoprotei archaeon]
MIPGFSPRELKRMLKKFGINVEELKDVNKVEISLANKKILIEKPQVLVIKTGSQEIYQVVGTSKIIEESKEISISDEDVEFVVSQTGVSREKAREALIKAGGDIAEAILLIKENRV